MKLEGNPAPPEPSMGMQTCSLSTASVPIPAIIDETNSQVESRYICRYRRQGGWEGFAEGLSYRLRHS